MAGIEKLEIHSKVGSFLKLLVSHQEAVGLES